MRGAVALLATLLLVSACAVPWNLPGGSQPAPNGPVGPQLDHPPSEGDLIEARLLLELAMGEGADQPGWMPGRVGGVEERGPLALAVDGETIYLADQAKGRILRFENGQLAGAIPTPWLWDQGVDLQVIPDGLRVIGAYEVCTVDLTGRLLTPPVHEYRGDETYLRWQNQLVIGQDQAGSRYERSLAQRGSSVQRLSPEGRVLARGLVRELTVADWYVTPEGGLYALAWPDCPGQVGQIRVYEVFPPDRSVDPTLPEARMADEPPVFQDVPVPQQIRFVSPGWAPVDVTAEVDRWNLWQLLATATPWLDREPAEEWWLGRLEATGPGGARLAVDLYSSQIVVEGNPYPYRTPHREALLAILDAARFSPEGLAAAFAAAERVTVAIPDLPGVERTLTAEETVQAAAGLEGAYPVNPRTPPQPLEEPFPRYALTLVGDGWQGRLFLRGTHYLVDPGRAALSYSGALAHLLPGWLPQPELAPESVASLYLTERLEIGQGEDLTRWKNSVVRHLLGVEMPTGELVSAEPITLTFFVGGEAQVVKITPEGFTYRGEWYPRPGLTDLIFMRGVP